MISALPRAGGRIEDLQAVAGHNLDFLRTTQLDRRLAGASGDFPVLRLAVLASSTVDHLLPALRVSALRHGYRLDVWLADYGQFRQAVLDRDSALYAFKPDAVLFALDARWLIGATLLPDDAAEVAVAGRVAEIAGLWRTLRGRNPCQIIQQAALPVFPALLGGAESRVAGTPASQIAMFNRELRKAAAAEGVDVLALDTQAARDGLAAWHSLSLWHRAKQEVTPAAGPMFGELVLRLIAADKGKSAKCLVLDLDNTLWGGVIGDDGLGGIELGQGSASGEAFTAFQQWVRMLGQRGVILAVCSKNDEANALEPFENHPEMVLRRGDIAAFVANWDDKAKNLRRIAQMLNIGLDSLVFVDDNPFERNIVRQELPMVRVPEVDDDPALWPDQLANAGYFESLGLTAEDYQRGALYQATQSLREGAVDESDLAGYLQSLDMRLVWGRFDPVSIKRVAQLTNKTNQFNLTTRRYSEAEMVAMIEDPAVIGLHLRLVDRFADHGIIGVVIGRDRGGGVLDLDTWLMSCRVLGRGVERATLAVLAQAARDAGFSALRGHFRPTAKNAMVSDHYANLGFADLDAQADGASSWLLHLEGALPEADHIVLENVT